MQVPDESTLADLRILFKRIESAKALAQTIPKGSLEQVAICMLPVYDLGKEPPVSLHTIHVWVESGMLFAGYLSF